MSACVVFVVCMTLLVSSALSVFLSACFSVRANARKKEVDMTNRADGHDRKIQ